MGIGLGIFLIVVGAILTFAVNASVAGIELNTVGWILMAGGALAVILGLVMNTQRSHTSHREVVNRNDDVDRREHRYDDRP